MTDPFASIEWPQPMLAKHDELREKMILEAVTVAEKRPPKSHSARVNFIRGVLRTAAEDLIPAAERILDASGAEKKRLVKEELIRLLRALEKRLHVIPDFLEPLAFKGLELALDSILQGVFDKLRLEGKV